MWTNFSTTIGEAQLHYNKGVCKSLAGLVRRGGRSLSDITNEIVQFAKNRYESMHLQYLAMTSMVRRQLENKSLVSYDKDLTTLPPNKPFGSYEYFDGYHGVISM